MTQPAFLCRLEFIQPVRILCIAKLVLENRETSILRICFRYKYLVKLYILEIYYSLNIFWEKNILILDQVLFLSRNSIQWKLRDINAEQHGEATQLRLVDHKYIY